MKEESDSTLKKLLRDVATRKAFSMLTETMLGRTLLKKLVSVASAQLGVPLQAQPCQEDKQFWILEAGAADADMQVRCRIRNTSLTAFAEMAATAWLENKPLPKNELHSFLRRALNSPR